MSSAKPDYDPFETPEMPEGVTLYDFDDFNTQRKLVFDTAKTTLTESFPMEHGGVRMEVSDIDYADPETVTIAQQKKAIMQNEYLTRRLRGKVSLYDRATGELLDETNKTLMRVPYLTNRGTFIHGGTEYTHARQLRLLPGSYSRRQDNGELETMFTVKAKTGHPFRVMFEPSKAQYRLKVRGSNLHLYSVLKDIGVKDDELKTIWGDELLDANAKGYDKRAFDKAYQKLASKQDLKPQATHSEKAEAIKRALEQAMVHETAVKRTLPNMLDMMKSASWRYTAYKMQKEIRTALDNIFKKRAEFIKQQPVDVALLAPAVDAATQSKQVSEEEDEDAAVLFIKEAAQLDMTYRTTEAKMEDDGETYTPVGVKGILASTEKLLAINKGIVEPDDRDHYAFKRIHSVDKFLRDKIRLDENKLRRNLMYGANKRRNLKGLSAFAFDPYAESLIVGNPLSMPLEEINPLHLAEQARRTTQMGPGGISDDSQITDSARSVNMSQVGFMSTVEGPENSRIGIDARLAWGAKYGSDGKLYQLIYDRRRKRMRYASADDLYGAVIGLPK